MPEHAPLLPKSEAPNGLLKILGIYVGLGGLLMATYVWGVLALNEKFGGNKANADQVGAANLWGAIYDDKMFLHVYYVGFVVAVVGYFLNFFHMLRVVASGGSSLSRDRYNKICLWFGVFFVSELLWMPGCVWYIGAPRGWLWWAIFLQLKVSGVAAIVWAVHWCLAAG